MTAVAPTVCIGNIRERLLSGNVVRVYAIAEQGIRSYIERSAAENATDGHALNNVDHVGGEPAAIGVSGTSARNKTQTLALRQRRRGCAGVEAQKICDWTGR